MLEFIVSVHCRGCRGQNLEFRFKYGLWLRVYTLGFRDDCDCGLGLRA